MRVIQSLHIQFILAAIIIATVAVAEEATPQPRTWVDSQGREIVATLVAISRDGRQIKLRKEGSAIDHVVSVDLLSDNDREYISQQKQARTTTGSSYRNCVSLTRVTCKGIPGLLSPNTLDGRFVVIPNPMPFPRLLEIRPQEPYLSLRPADGDGEGGLFLGYIMWDELMKSVQNKDVPTFEPNGPGPVMLISKQTGQPSWGFLFSLSDRVSGELRFTMENLPSQIIAPLITDKPTIKSTVFVDAAPPDRPASVLTTMDVAQLAAQLNDKTDHVNSLPVIDELGRRGPQAKIAVPKLENRLEQNVKESSSSKNSGFPSLKMGMLVGRLDEPNINEALHILAAIEKILPSDLPRFYQNTLKLDLDRTVCDKVAEGVLKLPRTDALTVLEHAARKPANIHMQDALDKALRSMGDAGVEIADKAKKRNRHGVTAKKNANEIRNMVLGLSNSPP